MRTATPIGKSRDRRRGRRPTPTPHDPADTEAYEHSWYALLAQHVEQPETESEPEPELATVTELVVEQAEPDPEPRPDREPAEGPLLRPEPAALAPAEPATPRGAPAPAAGPSGPAPDRPAIRIGIRRVAEPETVYFGYLTTSRHREFFRGDVWGSSRAATPAQLWRANHLGAAWELEMVERFLRETAEIAASVVASAPWSSPPGSPERRVWIERLLSSAWVADYGVARISKALFPLAPDLVPDLDPELTSFARARWFGIGETEGADELDRALETWELLEDVLVLRGRALAAISRRLRSLAPGLAPVGPLGLVLAVLWEDRWAEPEPDAAPRRRKARARPKAAGATRTETKAPRTRSTGRSTPEKTTAKTSKSQATGRGPEAPGSSQASSNKRS
ncbi:MAG TPA: hypothetical protein VF129_03960 [Actinomycetota bacterium]